MGTNTLPPYRISWRRELLLGRNALSQFDILLQKSRNAGEVSPELVIILDAPMKRSEMVRTVFERAAKAWREVIRELTDSYRPELHYMRGPGPKWAEKHNSAQAST
jgi:hypothetical protein